MTWSVARTATQVPSSVAEREQISSACADVRWWPTVKNQLSHSFPRPTAGIWLAHKPVGQTSFALVKQFQDAIAASPGRALKVMHGGALDPFASGLLPILVGPATKVFEWLHDAPKRYRAVISWGRETGTGDPLGADTASGGAADQLTAPMIESALKPFIGFTEQVPPNTSNKRVDGERAYVKAHRGEVFELAPSRVYLHSAVIIEHAPPSHTVVELVCRGGFYVRSLARDLGRALKVPAHLSALHRASIGPWEDPPSEETIRLEPRDTLPWLPQRTLGDDEWGRARRGVAIAVGSPQAVAKWKLPAGFPSPKPQLCGFHLESLVGLFDAHDNGTLTLKTELNGLAPS